MATVVLADLAFARPGDKGDISDVAVFATDRPTYDLLCEQVTAQRVAGLLGGLVTGSVTRHEVPNVLALKFVMTGALGGGGPSSLRADNLGKAMAGAVLRLPIEVDAVRAAAVGDRDRPPADPYADAAWRVP